MGWACCPAPCGTSRAQRRAAAWMASGPRAAIPDRRERGFPGPRRWTTPGRCVATAPDRPEVQGAARPGQANGIPRAARALRWRSPTGRPPMVAKPLAETPLPAARPSRAEAETAVRTLLRWAGEDPSREGLLDTPARVAKAYRDWFSGYALDPDDYLRRTFEEVAGYDELIVLRDIEFESHCEHHMAPIIGKVHVGYL